jgi:hypothetical protein
MSDFITDTQDVTFKTYDDGSAGDGLIRIQWRNGEARTKTGGYFFVASERLGDFVPSAPWEPYTDTFNDGTEAEGYKADALQIAVIAARQQPFIRKDTGKVWLEKYAKGEQGASLQVDVLCIAEGLEELGAIVWGSATVKTSFAIVGRPDGILHRIKSDILKPASDLAKRDMRPWCFWAPISTELDGKGKVVYTATQGKPVTRPVLALPPTVDKTWLQAQFTGKQMATFGENLREDYDEWVKERRTNEAPQPTEQPPTKNGNGHRNAPVELTEEDIPF